MELDSLKTVFLNKVQPLVVESSAAVIQKTIRKKSLSPVSLLKRNLQLEMTVAVIFSIFPVFIFVKYQGLYVSIFAVLTLLIIINFTLRIVKILQAIRRFEGAANALKQHLQLLISILSKFNSLYLQSTMIMLPLFFASAFFLIHLDNLERDPLFFQSTYQTTVVLYAIAFLLWSVAMYFFTKWYLNRVYGKHLQKLVELLKELTDN